MLEDEVLKKAMEFFMDNAVSFFCINTVITSPAETEIKNIDIKTGFTNYMEVIATYIFDMGKVEELEKYF